MGNILTYEFVQNAIMAGVLSSIVCGIIGVVVIEKKLVMMSGGIAHTSYCGVGLGYLLGFEPIIGAFVFSIAAALGIGAIKQKGGRRADVIIALFWSLGMALGIFFIALREGYPPDITSYLFGNILSVTRIDLYIMLALAAVVICVIAILWSNWKAYLFDEEFCLVRGIRTRLLRFVLLILIAMTSVILIRVVGIILVLALLTAPAAVAGMVTRSLGRRMIIAIVFGGLFCLTGLALSIVLNIASGASIVIISVLTYLAAYTFRALKSRSARYQIKIGE